MPLPPVAKVVKTFEKGQAIETLDEFRYLQGQAIETLYGFRYVQTKANATL